MYKWLTYFFFKHRMILSKAALLLLFPVSAQAQDEPCNATLLPVNGNCILMAASTTGATSSSGIPAPACGCYAGGDSWFYSIVPTSGTITFTTQDMGIFDASMQVFSGTCTSLTALGCDTDSSPYAAGAMGGSFMPEISLSGLTPGSTVWIRIWADCGSAAGDFNICASSETLPDCSSSPPAADWCTNATYICDLAGYCGNTGSSYTTTNPAGTDENTYLSWVSGGPFCGTIENNSWISFTATLPSVVLNVWSYNCSMGWGIQMQIYETADCLDFAPVSNCWFPGFASSGVITASGLTVGQTYYLMIDGADGDVCDYVIEPGSGVFTGVDAGEDQAICTGQSAQLNATNGIDVTWLPDPTLSSTTVANPVATPAATTTYYVTTTAGSGCNGSSAIDSVTVFVNDCPLTASVENDTICPGMCSTLQALVSGGTAPYSYAWDQGISSTDPVVTVCPDSTFTYRFIVSDATGNSDTLYPVVTVSVPPVVDLGPDTSLCTGPLLLNAQNPGAAYLWQDGSTGETISVVQSGTYFVSVTSSNCPASDTISILISGPDADLGPDTVLCAGNQLTLNAENTGMTYTWQDNSTLQTLQVNQAGIYSVTVSDGFCEDTDSVTVTLENPAVLFSVSDTTGCFPLTSVFSGSATSGQVTDWLWTFGDGTSSVSQQATHTYNQSGTYTVNLQVTTANGCVADTALPVLITITDRPHAAFSFSPPDPETGAAVTFQNQSAGAVSWAWQFGDGTTSGEQHPVHVFPAEGNFTVTLIVTNGACSDTVSLTIAIRDNLIFYVPNAFTPDGDECNNVFLPVFTSGFDPFGYELTIFDRWGELVFETNDPGTGWDGTYKRDGLVKEGVYSWVLAFGEKGNAERHTVTGHVVLLK